MVLAHIPDISAPNDWPDWLMAGLALAAMTMLGYRAWHLLAGRPRRAGNGGASFMLAGILVMLGLLGTRYLFRTLAPEKTPFSQPLTPGVRDEIVLIADAWRWSTIANQDVAAAGAEACQAFVAENAAALRALHAALQKPVKDPVPLTAANVEDWFTQIVLLQESANALRAHAKAALAAEQVSDAMACYLDMLRLSVVLSHGGLFLDDDYASKIGGAGIDGIVELLPQLDANWLSRLSKELKMFVGTRETSSSIQARNEVMVRANQSRLDRMINGPYRNSYETLALLHARSEDRLPLLQAEIAIRLYRDDEAKLPANLAALVPKYLAKVPQDPYGADPLIYRQTPDGYLLYSVGENGTDDGGRFLRRRRGAGEYAGLLGDLFVDSKLEAEKENER